MNSKRMIDCFCKYYSCCYDLHVMRLEKGVHRLESPEYKTVHRMADSLRKELKEQLTALRALEVEARIEAENDYRRYNK